MTQNYPNVPPNIPPQQMPPPGFPPPVMPPPGYSLPPTPQPARRNWGRIIGIVTSVVVVLVGLLIYIGHKATMGTAVKITDKETVNYSGNATEADARKLGDELKSIGYFKNNKEKDVLIRKDETGTTISFVVGDNWNTPEILGGFEFIAQHLDKALGKPIKFKLIDSDLKDLKEITVK